MITEERIAEITDQSTVEFLNRPFACIEILAEIFKEEYDEHYDFLNNWMNTLVSGEQDAHSFRRDFLRHWIDYKLGLE